MFELPDAKRVRREELYDSSSDRHSSPEREDEEDVKLRAELNARLSSLLSLDLGCPAAAAPIPAGPGTTTNEPHTADGEGQEEKAEAEFEFRLFSSAPPQKVVLAPDAGEAKYDGPAVSQRPILHYIRGELSPHEREQFRYAAVTGQDVLAWARQRAWGLEVPWRVTKITVTVNGKGPGVDEQKRSADSASAGEKKKKKRPGKKRRIVLRKREKAEKAKKEALERQKMSKEEHLREKKKRLNHQKKLRRRQKEKEKKLAAKAAAGGSEVASARASTPGSESGSDGQE
ncbi:hypothetical protein C8A03DRAFT_34196 [Achaetomium macrosporum]|uniref:Uncharacterized protein n=1 Tax=Achaetomium macrosporum TaxID=79813 RepID=A0AAN7C9D8_9PEZI|nr:hypothetical protein C8A03DRAFT_34196 [Achaetomium macrosporum]